MLGIDKKLEREDSYSLNGRWVCEIIKCPCIDTSFNNPKATTLSYNPPQYTKSILVPYSPETEKSGISHTLLPDEELWYKTHINYKRSDKDTILHFIAVDWRCVLFVNKKFVMYHEGGYTPFEANITKYLIEGDNTIELKVHDFSDSEPYCRGKQSLKPHGMWYRCQSGIWQSVYIENREKEYIKDIYTETLNDKEAIIIVSATSTGIAEVDFGFSKVYVETNKECMLDISKLELWHPNNPVLYLVKVTFLNDVVSSYFTFRYLSYSDSNRFMLNGKEFFSNGVLDQGYSPIGYLTLDEKEMEADLKLIKSLGFNTLRKHIKVESPIFYYLCDKIGLCVWQDMVSGGNPSIVVASLPAVVQGFKLSDKEHHKMFGRKEQKGKDEFIQSAEDTIKCLKNYKCIILWTIFNEGWGQFNSYDVYLHLRNFDKTRFFDNTSGWHDQKKGEIASYHYYFQTYKFKKDDRNRATVLSEFGGNIFRIKDHTYNDKDFIYKKTNSEEEFLNRLSEQFNNVKEQKQKGLTGSIYTQISDVEEESNGFITFDREVIKSDIQKLNKIISILNDK